LDNIRLPARSDRREAGIGSATPHDLIKLAGLSGFEHARSSQLSGGMQQRCAIARALVISPQILQEAVFMADKIFVLAARPGRIIDTAPVALARPRRFSQMNEPSFVAVVNRVRNSLFGDQAGMLSNG